MAKKQTMRRFTIEPTLIDVKRTEIGKCQITVSQYGQKRVKLIDMNSYAIAQMIRGIRKFLAEDRAAYNNMIGVVERELTAE